ncbi:MAG: YjgP/YjgQ family permease [Gemmatimonadetes bacterium]|nr:YjgP/YjgQ family permease [Gemmatimonadota bacterium]
MRILDRYVLREFVKLFVLFSVAAPLLFVLGDWTDNIDTFTERQIPTARVALSYVYQMPEFISWSLPIAALIATVFTVSNMTRHSEMAAAKAGGISFYSALRMLPLLGILLTLLGLGLSELVPVTEGLRRQALATCAGPGGAAGGSAAGQRCQENRSYSRTEFVYNSAAGDTYTIITLNADNQTISDLTVERPGDLEDAPGIFITSDVATWDTISHGWVLHDGHYRMVLDDSTERTIAFAELRSARFRETPEQLSAVPKEPEEMRYAELGDYIENLERSGARPLKLMVRRLEKVAIPIATLIIILFGAPLANSSSRGGPAYGIGVSLGVTITYLMMFKVTEAAGATGSLPIYAAAWLPNALFAVAAGMLLWRIRT